MSYPGKNNTSFKVTFKEDWFKLDQTMESSLYKVKILTLPNKKWYKRLLQFVSFDLYKAPYEYLVTPI
jgi:hypothetical protein